MGNYFAVNMEENFKRNQKFITEMNAIKMERQLQMQDQMRQRQTALIVAKNRELFFWYSAFYLTVSVISLSSFMKRKKPAVLAPLLPLSFILAYQGDLAYGNKLHRIRVEAEHILQFEDDLLQLPLGVPTASTIDLKRLENDEQKKLHPVIP